MVEDTNPEAVILPARDFMDAAEAVSWIAYGKAIRKWYWCKNLFKLSRDWQFHDAIGVNTEDPPGGLFDDKWFSNAEELLSTFKARAVGSLWPPYPRIKTEKGREIAEQYLARLNVSDASGWSAFGRQLKSDIERRNVFLEKLRVAAGKLRRELYKGRLTAWGSKDTDDPFNGPPRQKMLSDEWPPGVEIDFDGHVREKEGWDWGIRWMMLSFDTEEVLSIWPPSLFQPQGRIAYDKSEPDTSANDSISEWILTHVRSEGTRLGAPPKRDATLKACQAATQCSYREARAAWEALPADTKRRPRSAKRLMGDPVSQQ